MEEHEHKEAGTVTIKKSDLWKYSTFLLAVVVIIGAFVMFTGKDTTTITGNVPAGTEEPTTAKATVDDDAMIGDKDAPVTIIEFSDYQCPFCRKFWGETYPQIKSEYIEKGKVKLIFRDFPLTSLHPMAQPSAEAAECVREKGGDEAYFKMHDKMFSEQNILDSGSPTGAVTKTAVYTNQDLKNWAKYLGYDISSCLDSGKYKLEVEKDIADAQKAGGSGTPYFIINGKVLSGAQPFSVFEKIIEEELNR